MMNKNSKIYVAGHRGLVGSAITRKLKELGFNNLILRSRSELDLLSQESVKKFFELERPEYVFLAAAKVGGIYANSKYPADFIYENLLIESNIIYNSFISIFFIIIIFSINFITKCRRSSTTIISNFYFYKTIFSFGFTIRILN